MALRPSLLPFPPGSYSPRTAAIAITNNGIQQQTAMLDMTRGGARKPTQLTQRRRYRGRGGADAGATTISVPSFPTIYPTVGSNGQTMAGNILGVTKLGATINANSIYDNCVGQTMCTPQAGGNRRRRRTFRHGGSHITTGVKWGCYSGGRRTRKSAAKNNRRRTISRSGNKMRRNSRNKK